jgi:centromeric protein E
MAEELSYAKELASAAGVELKNLSEEITKLSYHNTKLAAELTNAKGSAYARPKSKSVPRQRANAVIAQRLEGAVAEELKRELLASKEKEVALEGRLAQRDRKDAEMQQKLEDMKRREADLEKELASARLVLANIKHEASEDGAICLGYRELLEFQGQSGATEDAGSKNVGALMEALANERSHTAELETLISQLKVTCYIYFHLQVFLFIVSTL